MHGEQFKQMTVALAIGGGKMDCATVTLARVTSIFSWTLIPYLMSYTKRKHRWIRLTLKCRTNFWGKNS